jgi:hypothetical protein
MWRSRISAGQVNAVVAVFQPGHRLAQLGSGNYQQRSKTKDVRKKPQTMVFYTFKYSFHYLPLFSIFHP